MQEVTVIGIYPGKYSFHERRAQLIETADLHPCFRYRRFAVMTE